jgi:hypothetical protein
MSTAEALFCYGQHVTGHASAQFRGCALQIWFQVLEEVIALQQFVLT